METPDEPNGNLNTPTDHRTQFNQVRLGEAQCGGRPVAIEPLWAREGHSTLRRTTMIQILIDGVMSSRDRVVNIPAVRLLQWSSQHEMRQTVVAIVNVEAHLWSWAISVRWCKRVK